MIVLFTMKQYALIAARSARVLAKDTGVTHVRLDVLVALFDGPLLQRDLSIAFCVCPSVMCRLLGAVEKLGLVARTKLPGDRRQRIVELTPNGRGIVEQIHHDGVMPAAAGYTAQYAGEEHVRFEWCSHFAARGVSYGPLTKDDASPLVFEVVPTIRRIRDDDYFSAVRETRPSPPMDSAELSSILDDIRARDAA